MVFIPVEPLLRCSKWQVRLKKTETHEKAFVVFLMFFQLLDRRSGDVYSHKLVDLNGNEVRFSQFLGKRYILYVWASW